MASSGGEMRLSGDNGFLLKDHFSRVDGGTSCTYERYVLNRVWTHEKFIN